MCEREGWRTISRKFVRKLWPEEMESGVCSALSRPLRWLLGKRRKRKEDVENENVEVFIHLEK